MWVKLAKLFSSFMQSKGVALLTSYALKALGIAGGFWGWLVGIAVKWGWKKADKEVQSGARLADRTKSDSEIREEYLNKLKGGASEEELIDSESAILNGGRK